MHYIDAIDWGTYSTFHDLRPGWPDPLTRLVQGGSLLGSYLVLGVVLLAAAAWLLTTGRWRTAGLLAGMVVGSAALVEALKLIFARERTSDWRSSWLAAGGPLLGGTQHSFPSGHAFVSVVTYGMLAVVLARGLGRLTQQLAVYALAIIVVLAIGACQLFLGAELLSDVLAGWAGGAALVLVGSQLAPPPAQTQQG
jgi:undecaprenyl-diphosphatase